MEPLAYSYVRFSSLQQGDGDSERRQNDKFAQYCRSKGIAASPHKFTDRGRSGFKAEHLSDTGELRRFLNLVESGEIMAGSVLVVESLDRLGRQEVTEALGVFLGIIGAGIRIVTLGGSGEQEFVKGGGPIPLLIAIMEMYRAHSESAFKLQRLRETYDEKRVQARDLKVPMGDVAPLWLRLKECWRSYEQDGSAYEELPERAIVVRDVFRWTLEGDGREVIAKRLTAAGVPTFKSDNEKLKARGFARGWSTSSINKILKNRAVFGEYQPRTTQGKPASAPRNARIDAGDAIPGYFPNVVEVQTFYEVQAAIDGRRTSKATKQAANGSLWQGVAKCEKCGAGMQLVDKGTPPKGGRYLRCGNIRNGVCKARAVRLEHAEEVFKGMVLRLDALALVKDESAQLEKVLRSAEGRHATAKQKLQTLEQRLDEMPGSPTIAKHIGRAETEVATAASEMLQLKHELAAESSIGWEEFLKKLDLVTYAGRTRANALMKRLGVLVFVGPSGYVVTQNGQERFAMDYRDGEGAGYWMSRGSGSFLPYFLPVADVPNITTAADADEARYEALESDGHPAGIDRPDSMGKVARKMAKKAR